MLQNKNVQTWRVVSPYILFIYLLHSAWSQAKPNTDEQ